MPKTIKATAFVEPERIELREKPVPEVGSLDALLRVTTTTLCGTEVHVMKGGYELFAHQRDGVMKVVITP